MRYIYFALAAVALISCSHAQQHLPAIRPYEFNDSGYQVITTMINEKANSVAMLYGNKAAMNLPSSGAVYKLVTYREQDNQFWFGSYINGELLSVETVDMTPVANGQPPAYQFKPYHGATAPSDAATRTAFIQSLQPAWYPCDPQ
ncbi:hypothetical protein HGH93_13860 [Chitinophaga polysaccharea]|uniref:hypothetical protein n=1 Tax=Chitinophaga TaxID=79328 RepID=UPI001455A740|nr:MULTISPECIES: hypothetical protein [Chitinophaga]NLR59196.1 hypothetical protein [Chitinophaga polysaccharea]NLU92035.1 hypothetical protein [Chitinophaga sp. Ak27]